MKKKFINWTYCGNYFTVYVNQTIMLYTLNLYSDECQLFLNKTVNKVRKHYPNGWNRIADSDFTF